MAVQGSLLYSGVSSVLVWNSYIIEAQEIDSVCAVCRLLQPLEQALPGRRHYMNGLKCLERRIHSTTRLKLYSKIKADTDFQTAGALTWFTVMLPSAFHKTRWLKAHIQKGGGQVIRASSSGHNVTAFFSVLYLTCTSRLCFFCGATKIKIKGYLPARPFIVLVCKSIQFFPYIATS